MASACCERIRESLSAYADQTLAPRRWEQVSYHLAGCAECRAELAAIDAVCNELSRCRASDPSASLAARLESIAGEHAEAPLYMASGPGELPSARRTRSRRVTQGSVAVLLAVMSVVVLAVLIAPDPLRVADPVGAAREQFSMSTSAIGSSESVGAVLLAFERGADLGESVTYQPLAREEALVEVSATRAAELLQRAAQSTIGVNGTQRVWIADGHGLYRSAEVRTARVAGEGAQLEVLDARGDRFMSAFLPALGSHAVEAPKGWTFAEGQGGEAISGRSAVHLEAGRDGSPVAGWWFDSDTGVLLWQERYASDGTVAIAAGFKQLRFEEATLNAGNVQLIALQPASRSQTDGWCIGLPECPQELGGLPLVAYASSDRGLRRSMTLVYSDGFESAVVGWTEGLLADGEMSTSTQSSGIPTLYWQSGDAVIWVTTNGSYDLLGEISARLPQEAPYSASLVDRVVAGLDRLIPVG